MNVKPVQSIYTEYKRKNFEIPKALFFGKYENMTMNARFHLSFFKEISKINELGFLYLNLKEITEYKDVIKELEKYELIHISNEKVYFLDVQINDEIIKGIQNIEQNKKINIKSDKEKKQEKLIEKAYYSNNDLPERLKKTIQIFSHSVDEAEKFFVIIMKAKRKIEKDYNEVIWLDDDDEMLDVIINAFSRSFRKINKGNIKNKNGYIYNAIITNVSQVIKKRNYKNCSEGEFDWLEDHLI